MAEPIHVISLGAGVQSSTMALMAGEEKIEPMPSAAIFADTQSEPKAVYEWLGKLEGMLPFPLYRVTAGNLEESILRRRVNKKTGNPYYSTYIPAFVVSPNGKRGILRRKCTYDFKVKPLTRQQRELVGNQMLPWRRKHKAALKALREAKKAKTPAPLWAWQECQSDPLMVVWIGISLDEATRMKPSREPWAVHRWPLIEQNMTRQDCVKWLWHRNIEQPVKSACRYCPYHNDTMWQEMKDTQPEEFAGAVQFEKDFQAICADGATTQVPYLHDSLKPLDEVIFNQPKPIHWNSPEGKQILFPNGFENECEGMCGV